MRSHLYIINKITCGGKTGYFTLVLMADPYTPKEVADEFFTTPYSEILSGKNIQTRDNVDQEEALAFFKEAFFIYESLNLIKLSARGCKMNKQENWTDELTGRLTDDQSGPLTNQIFEALKKLGRKPKITFVFNDEKFINVKNSLKKKC
jgi:hypothetical protein